MNNLSNSLDPNKSNQYVFGGISVDESRKIAQAKISTKQVPVYKGCWAANNEGCYCSGQCKEIIGYRDRFPGELTPGII